MPAANGDDELFARLQALKNGETVVTIGAGCSGLALLQEMVRLGERRTIICVDRNDKVGGMWLTPYEGLGLHGPRKSVSHPSTYHLWKDLGVPDGQAKPADLCRYFAAVQIFLEERGVRFLLGATVERVDDVLTVSKNGARATLDPIEYCVDARCSNIKVRPPHGFAKPLKETPGRKDTLIIGSGKQGADVAIQRIRSLGDEITFASRVPIAFVAREYLTDPNKGLFAVLFRLSKMKTKQEWLSCCEDMVGEGVLINPWEEAAGNDGIEFHGGILSAGEVETLRQTKFARGEFKLTGEDSFCQEFGTVLRCTGAFREAAVRDEINDNERMKSMRFLYTPIASAQREPARAPAPKCPRHMTILLMGDPPTERERERERRPLRTHTLSHFACISHPLRCSRDLQSSVPSARTASTSTRSTTPSTRTASQ